MQSYAESCYSYLVAFGCHFCVVLLFNMQFFAFVFVQQKSIAPMVHRQQTVDSLKKFNARRKLKVYYVPVTVS